MYNFIGHQNMAILKNPNQMGKKEDVYSLGYSSLTKWVNCYWSRCVQLYEVSCDWFWFMPMLIIYFQNLVDLDTDTDSKWVVGWNGNSECGSQDELSCC